MKAPTASVYAISHLFVAALVAVLALAEASPTGAQTANRVTILYDAFGPSSGLEKDWGFAALVEYGGRRILFDTGNDARIFATNLTRLGVDLGRLDAVVISHRHGDHTSGLTHVLQRNPNVRIYAPAEAGFFKGPFSREFLVPHPGLPDNLRYFDGRAPARWVSGTPWEEGHFEIVTKRVEILPGFYLLTTRSEKAGTIEMNEVSLAIRTPRGLAVVVGCSHPGVEMILEQAATIEARLHTVIGGFHLVLTPEPEVQRIAGLLRDTLKIDRVAPGHCTSELGFAVFLDRFKERFDAAGLGTVLALP
jgi:7,8-dihydropterin-6-yl-methyl-4-(beta-D-ribofuranosyl)aminobenzene 5'-phosphate synthase